MYSQSVKMHRTGRCEQAYDLPPCEWLQADYSSCQPHRLPVEALLSTQTGTVAVPSSALRGSFAAKASCHLLFVPQFMSPGHLTESLFIIIDSWLHNTDQKDYTGHRNFPYKSHDVKTHHRPSTASVKVWLGDNYCIRMQFTLIISKSLQTLKSASGYERAEKGLGGTQHKGFTSRTDTPGSGREYRPHKPASRLNSGIHQHEKTDTQSTVFPVLSIIWLSSSTFSIPKILMKTQSISWKNILFRNKINIDRVLVCAETEKTELRQYSH